MESPRSYTVIVKADPDGGFWTQVPALPGCGSQGDTIEETLKNTTEAIEGYIASMRKHGETPPADVHSVAEVTVSLEADIHTGSAA